MRAFLLACALLAALVGTAHAQVSSPRAPMHAYFESERDAAWPFLGTGVAMAALGTAAAWTNRGGDWTQARWPLWSFGVVEVVAGAVLRTTTPNRIVRQDAEIATDPPAWLAREIPRVQRVGWTLTALQITECATIAGGLGLFTYGQVHERPGMRAVGAGLAVGALSLLALDVAAHGRATHYLRALQGLSLSHDTALVLLGTHF